MPDLVSDFNIFRLMACRLLNRILYTNKLLHEHNYARIYVAVYFLTNDVIRKSNAHAYTTHSSGGSTKKAKAKASVHRKGHFKEALSFDETARK